MSEWSLVYEKAVRPDGSLYFPERLTREFLEEAKKSMGSYFFANQYQNEIVPAEDQTFKRSWLKYYTHLPETKLTFAFIDPAISQADAADFTALTVIDVDTDGIWYVRCAQRFKINPTQIMNLVFKVNQQFKPMAIGIEDVAYQKALIYMIAEEIKRTKVVVPVKGIHPGTDKTKQMRILGLVPRFEWGRILLSQGMVDFEMEYAQFPRGAHDDLLDSLSQLEQIVFYPQVKKEVISEPHSPADPNYERWYINQLHNKKGRRSQDDED